MRVRYLGTVDYGRVFQAMLEFVANPKAQGGEQLWICEHPPVYTLGRSSVNERPMGSSGIPVVQADRGGHITYHGPGQVVAYPLINLGARDYFAREYVARVEQAVLCTLAHFDVRGYRVPRAPGVFVRVGGAASTGPDPCRDGVTDFGGLGKIAALGIKVRNHHTYHGVALNVAMDLAPFERINPCGYAGLRTMDMASLGVAPSSNEVARQLAADLCEQLA